MPSGSISRDRLSGDNNFNLLRLLFATMVTLSHAPELVDGGRERELLTRLTGQLTFGDLGVDCFFILSGFLVTRSWLSNPKLWPYLKKRLLRLYPGFVVASLLSAFAVGPLSGSEYLANFEPLEYLKSLLLLGVPRVPPVFSPAQPHPLVNGSLWSLPLEGLCYLGVAGLGLVGLFKRRWTIGVLAACWLAFWIAWQNGAFAPWLILEVLEQLCLPLGACFLAGALFYLYLDKVRLSPWLALASCAALAAAAVCGGFAIVWAVCGSYLLFFLAFADTPRLRRFQHLPDVSYGVYLYSWPWYKVLLFLHPDFSPWQLFPLNLALSIGSGYLSWRFVERRFKAEGRASPLRLRPAGGAARLRRG